MKPNRALLPISLAVVASAQQPAWSQCGGINWTGGTTCVSGTTCTVLNSYYYQCIPGTASSAATTSTTARSVSTTKTSSSATSAPTQCKYAGVNMAGFDFGVTTDGSQVLSAVTAPPTNQFAHFVNNDKLNLFRIPAGWQFLVNNVLGGTLDPNNFARYDNVVQACLSTGASCIIDVHNYARWNGAIVGQGGPTNAQLTSLWSQLATKYKGNSRIIFGVMNEPHDIPSITTWAATVQACVTAIRSAGATSQMILLPGNDYTSAGSFVSDGSLAALSTVTNLDRSTTNLVFDVHKYLDSDNSGTHAECVSNDISSAFQPLAASLRAIGRQALLSETGGGNTASCITYVCQEIAYLNANADVYLGYSGWSAGAFLPSYVLSLVPTQNGNTWTDTSLMAACFSR